MQANRLPENAVISVTGRGATKEFSTLITNEIPDLEMMSKGQCFPIYLHTVETTREAVGNAASAAISDSCNSELQQRAATASCNSAANDSRYRTTA